MHTLLLFLLLYPQTYEYGKPEELRGLTRVFIDTGEDTRARDHLTKELRKAKLNLVFLDTIETAEILLSFKPSTTDKLMGSQANGRGSIAEVTLLTGKGLVLIPKGEHTRLILSFEDTQENIFEKKPVTNFAKEFIKVFKKANNIK